MEQFKKLFTKVNSLVFMLIYLVIISDRVGKRLIEQSETDIIANISYIILIIVNLSIAILIWYIFVPGIHKQAKKGTLNQTRFDKIFNYTFILSIVILIIYFVLIIGGFNETTLMHIIQVVGGF